MIPHVCLVGHNPPNSYGDCLRACVASILNEQLTETVPHFLHDGDDVAGSIRLKEFLVSKGYRPFYMGLKGDNSLDDLFVMMKEINRDIEYLLFCNSGGGGHVVVCCNDKIIHNPSWVRSPIEGPTEHGLWVIVVLVPINP